LKLNLHPKGIPKQEPLGADTPLKKGGVVVGMRKEGDKEKIYFVGDDCHLLCVGATRSGKSRCLVLESICLLGLAGESIFCSDPKAELFHYTADFLKKLGYEVLVLDFKNPEKSMRYEQPVVRPEKAPEPDEIIPYRWNARNIRIAVAGSQRRSGVTVTAFNLASWLAARGAEVAYIEVNQNRHLQLLLNLYEAVPDGEHYTIDGIDCYLTNEPDKTYQFIIYDCGMMQTPTSIFRDADHRLLCGSVLPYEIPAFHKALSECGSLEVCPVAICVPQEIQEYCMELFGENMQIAAASHNLFAKRANGQIYRPLVEKYIAGEKSL